MIKPCHSIAYGLSRADLNEAEPYFRPIILYDEVLNKRLACYGIFQNAVSSIICLWLGTGKLPWVLESRRNNPKKVTPPIDFKGEEVKIFIGKIYLSDIGEKT